MSPSYLTAEVPLFPVEKPPTLRIIFMFQRVPDTRDCTAPMNQSAKVQNRGRREEGSPRAQQVA